MPALKRGRGRGFTLIELVIGISVMSIALLFMTGVMFPQAERSTNPWFQVRSAELAQSFMSEILARSFDENSPRSGGQLRCDEGGTPCEAALPTDCAGSPDWVEEASRDLYDDVDDFHCFSATGDEITDIEGEALTDVYKSFTVDVAVVYAGTELGLSSNRLAKRIRVTVTSPNGEALAYTSYKANY